MSEAPSVSAGVAAFDALSPIRGGAAARRPAADRDAWVAGNARASPVRHAARDAATRPKSSGGRSRRMTGARRSTIIRASASSRRRRRSPRRRGAGPRTSSAARRRQRRGRRQALAEGNREYERRFGHIYLVCATGKSAEEMLALLRTRLTNDPATELRVAAGEQAKITRLRLEKLFALDLRTPARAMISTHVLDTSRGQPAADVRVILERLAVEAASTREMTRARDGRGWPRAGARSRMALARGGAISSHVRYGRRISRRLGVEPFYPAVVVCSIGSGHERSTITCRCCSSPYGYSTYRRDRRTASSALLRGVADRPLATSSGAIGSAIQRPVDTVCG